MPRAAGWDPFGPERLITRSEGNVLYELDGKSALDLYKRYLGEHSQELPASGLRFPLSLRIPGADTRLVRTILAVDEPHQSMRFAGDVPQGAYAQLMKANFDRLIDGAIESRPREPRDAGVRAAACAARELRRPQIGSRAAHRGRSRRRQRSVRRPDPHCRLLFLSRSARS